MEKVALFCNPALGTRSQALQWGSTTGNAATVAHSTKENKAEKIP
jgi:hypothetical protein